MGAESPAKRTRLSAKSCPNKEQSAVEAKRAAQSDDLDRDVKQVMDYADEKVISDEYKTGISITVPIMKCCSALTSCT